MRCVSQSWVLYGIVRAARLTDDMMLNLAAHTAQLPTTTYDAETGQTVCSPVESRSLELNSLPLSCTIGLYDKWVQPRSSLHSPP